MSAVWPTRPVYEEQAAVTEVTYQDEDERRPIILVGQGFYQGIKLVKKCGIHL